MRWTLLAALVCVWWSATPADLAGVAFDAPCGPDTEDRDRYELEWCSLPGAVGCREMWKRVTIPLKAYAEPPFLPWAAPGRYAWHPDPTDIPPGRTTLWVRVRARLADESGDWVGEDPEPLACNDHDVPVLEIDITGIRRMCVEGSGHQAGLDPAVFFPCPWPPSLDARPAP